MGRCCYCGTLTLKNSGRTFHKFPFKNPKLLKKWLDKLPLKNWKPQEASIICSDHFAEDCLDKSGFRTRLHFDSVPTIFNDPRGLCVSCKRKREPQDKSIFFKFPHENPELLRKWVENINIPGWWPKAENLLCSRHFEPLTMAFKDGKAAKLNAESVPTLFSRENSNASNFEAIDENLMNQSAKIAENSTNLKELNYDEKADNFDIDGIFLDFSNNKLPFFDATEGQNGNYGIPNYSDAEDVFDGFNKRGSGDSIDSKIAEYERSIVEKEKIIELQKKKIKQLQDRISSFNEVILDLCRDRSVSQTLPKNFGCSDAEN